MTHIPLPLPAEHSPLWLDRSERSESGGTLLDELRAWVGGLERIGDAEQMVALLLQNEVSLANLGLFSVDDLAAIGLRTPVACELHAQFNRRRLADMQSARALPQGPNATLFSLGFAFIST